MNFSLSLEITCNGPNQLVGLSPVVHNTIGGYTGTGGRNYPAAYGGSTDAAAEPAQREAGQS